MMPPFEIPEEMKTAMDVAARRQARLPRFAEPNEQGGVELEAPEYEALRIVAAYTSHMLAHVDGDPFEPRMQRYLDAAVLALSDNTARYTAALGAIADEMATEKPYDSLVPEMRHLILMSTTRVVSALAELLRLGRFSIENMAERGRGDSLDDVIGEASRDLQA